MKTISFVLSFVFGLVFFSGALANQGNLAPKVITPEALASAVNQPNTDDFAYFLLLSNHPFGMHRNGANVRTNFQNAGSLNNSELRALIRLYEPMWGDNKSFRYVAVFEKNIALTTEEVARVNSDISGIRVAPVPNKDFPVEELSALLSNRKFVLACKANGVIIDSNFAGGEAVAVRDVAVAKTATAKNAQETAAQRLRRYRDYVNAKRSGKSATRGAATSKVEPGPTGGKPESGNASGKAGATTVSAKAKKPVESKSRLPFDANQFKVDNFELISVSYNKKLPFTGRIDFDIRRNEDSTIVGSSTIRGMKIDPSLTVADANVKLSKDIKLTIPFGTAGKRPVVYTGDKTIGVGQVVNVEVTMTPPAGNESVQPVILKYQLGPFQADGKVMESDQLKDLTAKRDAPPPLPFEAQNFELTVIGYNPKVGDLRSQIDFEILEKESRKIVGVVSFRGLTINSKLTVADKDIALGQEVKLPVPFGATGQGSVVYTGLKEIAVGQVVNVEITLAPPVGSDPKKPLLFKYRLGPFHASGKSMDDVALANLTAQRNPPPDAPSVSFLDSVDIWAYKNFGFHNFVTILFWLFCAVGLVFALLWWGSYANKRSKGLHPETILEIEEEREKSVALASAPIVNQSLTEEDKQLQSVLDKSPVARKAFDRAADFMKRQDLQIVASEAKVRDLESQLAVVKEKNAQIEQGLAMAAKRELSLLKEVESIGANMVEAVTVTVNPDKIRLYASVSAKQLWFALGAVLSAIKESKHASDPVVKKVVRAMTRIVNPEDQQELVALMRAAQDELKALKEAQLPLDKKFSDWSTEAQQTFIAQLHKLIGEGGQILRDDLLIDLMSHPNFATNLVIVAGRSPGLLDKLVEILAKLLEKDGSEKKKAIQVVRSGLSDLLQDLNRPTGSRFPEVAPSPGNGALVTNGVVNGKHI